MAFESISSVIVLFPGAKVASFLVAGIPAAARALREVARSGAQFCTIAVSGGWRPDPRTQGELHRMADGMPFAIADTSALPRSNQACLLLAGDALAPAATIRAALARGTWAPADGHVLIAPPGQWRDVVRRNESEALASLRRAAAAIVAATGKPGDGIVSRWINRPVSQALSRVALRFPAVRPIHATAATAFVAMFMLACLVAGGAPGLIAGALLFQASSILDGVDGEIARATFRTSDSGAMADSLIDAATNVAFIGGVVINLWIAGDVYAAWAGAVGLACMASGLFLIGLRAHMTKQQFTFNGVKDHFGQRPTRLKRWLTWLTMRDFYAFAGVLFVVTGHAAQGLIAFAVVATGWFVVVLAVMARKLA
jgi:CDP-L-myo-inositol myo-inositolphosphotransferase